MKKLNLILSSLAVFALSACCENCESAKLETVQLFNGKDLSNWNFVLDPAGKADAKEVFTVKDSVISVKGQPFGYMYTKEKYSNFVLTVEWRYPEKASNSGIFLYLQNQNFWPTCIEMQLCSQAAGDFVLMAGADMAEFKLPEGKERPKFPVVAKSKPSSENPIGQWNTAEIACKDGEISVRINGVLQNIGHVKYKSGNIALQSEGDRIEFRKVELVKIK